MVTSALWLGWGMAGLQAGSSQSRPALRLGVRHPLECAITSVRRRIQAQHHALLLVTDRLRAAAQNVRLPNHTRQAPGMMMTSAYGMQRPSCGSYSSRCTCVRPNRCGCCRCRCSGRHPTCCCRCCWRYCLDRCCWLG